MKKKVVTFALVFCFVVTAVFAQAYNASNVATWLNRAVSATERAVRLARSDVERNVDEINALISEARDLLLRVQNWANRGNQLTERQIGQTQTIAANFTEVDQRLMFALR